MVRVLTLNAFHWTSLFMQASFNFFHFSPYAHYNICLEDQQVRNLQVCFLGYSTV